MNPRSKYLLALFVVLVVLAGVVALVLWPEEPVRAPDERLDEPGESAFEAHTADEATAASAPASAQAPLAPRVGQMLRFTLASADHVPAVEATIGVAGMWPPAEANAPVGGLVPLPRPEVSTLWGDETSTVEVLARTVDRAHGFWGDVSTADLDDPGIKDVGLAEASPLEVVVTDKDDEPVAGAEVRISRGFVGLVHLSKETDERGVASFAGLPGGDYRVSVKADGFARDVRRVGHEPAAERVSLALERGPTRIGNGELEALADAVVVDGNRTVVSTGEEDDEGEGDSAEPVRHPLDLYVVDRTGSPVSGALVQLWKGAQKVHEATSGGRTPVRIEVAAPFRGRLVAFDGRRGEGSVAVEVSARPGEHEFVVRLDRALLTLDLPPGRVNQRGRIEQILGAQLVRDNDAWLADILSPSSPAAKAGIARGDRVVFLRQGAGGYTALIERGAERLSVNVPAE